jgi:hypothetical protein
LRIKQCWIVAELDALQAETPVKHTGQAGADPPSSDFGATRLGALLLAILDRAFKREL